MWSQSEDGHSGKLPGDLPLWWPAPWKHTVICPSRHPGWKAHNYECIVISSSRDYKTTGLVFTSLPANGIDSSPRMRIQLIFFSLFSPLFFFVRYRTVLTCEDLQDRTRKERKKEKKQKQLTVPTSHNLDWLGGRISPWIFQTVHNGVLKSLRSPERERFF